MLSIGTKQGYIANCMVQMSPIIISKAISINSNYDVRVGQMGIYLIVDR